MQTKTVEINEIEVNESVGVSASNKAIAVNADTVCKTYDVLSSSSTNNVSVTDGVVPYCNESQESLREKLTKMNFMYYELLKKSKDFVEDLQLYAKYNQSAIDGELVNIYLQIDIFTENGNKVLGDPLDVKDYNPITLNVLNVAKS